MLPMSAINRAKGPPICHTKMLRRGACSQLAPCSGVGVPDRSAVWKSAIENDVPVE